MACPRSGTSSWGRYIAHPLQPLVTDVGLRELASLTKLTKLYLRRTSPTQAGRDALKGCSPPPSPLSPRGRQAGGFGVHYPSETAPTYTSCPQHTYRIRRGGGQPVLDLAARRLDMVRRLLRRVQLSERPVRCRRLRLLHHHGRRLCAIAAARHVPSSAHGQARQPDPAQPLCQVLVESNRAVHSDVLETK